METPQKTVLAFLATALVLFTAAVKTSDIDPEKESIDPAEEESVDTEEESTDVEEEDTDSEDEDTEEESTEEESSVAVAPVVVEKVKKKKKTKAYVPVVLPDSGLPNTAARPVHKERSFDMFVEGLYWQVQEGKTEWALGTFDEDPLADGTPVTKNHFKKVDFDWSWGFRGGIGYHMLHDEWDTQLYYTWLYTHKTDRFSQSDTSSNAAFGFSGVAHNQGQILSLLSLNPKNGDVNFSNGKIQWAVHFNCGDWELGRNYNVSKYLTLRPHLGIKGGWIHQNIKGNFIEETSPSSEGTPPTIGTLSFRYKNHFWGVGPSGGVNTSWYLGKGTSQSFSIFGDLAGALLYGRFHVREENFENSEPNGEWGEQKFSNLNRTLAAPVFQVATGISWDIKFSHDQYRFGIKLGYELQYWFRQNQLMSLADFMPQRLDGDLSLQGGTGELTFDF